MTKDVTTPNTPMPVSGEEPLRKAPKIEPPKAASGFAFPGGKGKNDAKSDFKLPESVSPSEVRDQSFRYGGGRTAGGGTPSAPIRDGRRS